MIPSFEAFLFPVLYLLKDGSPMKRDELRAACEKYMGFSDEELQERISSGKKYKIVDRLQWATYYLLKAGLLLRPDHATDQITEEGKVLVDSGVTEINRQYLREHYQSYRDFEIQTRESAKQRQVEKAGKLSPKPKKKSIQKKDSTHGSKKTVKIDDEPIVHNIEFSNAPLTLDKKLSQIEEEVEMLTQGLINELKDIVNDFDKESFRCLLLELIPKMGYSSVFEDYNINAKMAHDIALSGFFNIDEMGLNRFFVLAHNKTTEEISQIDVQSFIGALSSMGVNMGVYITTSTFSSEALAYQTNGSIRCVLIDGIALAKLMAKFNIGVVTRKIFEVKDVDQEYLFTRLTQSQK